MIGIGDILVYDVGIEDTSLGIVQKIYWDGSIGVLDPYALDEGKTEYRIVEREQIVQYFHRNLVDQLLISLGKRLSKLMPLEMYPLLTILAGIIIYIVKH